MQRTAEGLEDVAFDLIAQAVGIHYQAAIVRAGYPPDFDFAGFFVHGERDADGDVVLRLFVARIRDAAPD